MNGGSLYSIPRANGDTVASLLQYVISHIKPSFVLYFHIKQLKQNTYGNIKYHDGC